MKLRANPGLASNVLYSRRKARALVRPAAEVLESRLLLAGDTSPSPPHLLAADTASPVIKSIQLPPAGTYGTNATLTFRVNFNEPVTVTGSPTLPVGIGLSIQQAALAGYAQGTYTRSLVFKTKVDANASSDNTGITLGTVGVASGAVVQLLGSADGIKDRAGNEANPVIPASVNTNRILVDAVGPVVQSYGFKNLPASTIKSGRRISVQVKFDEPVTVTGRPTVPFSIGAVPYQLTFAGGTGTRTLLFTYRTTSATNPRVVSFTPGLGEVMYLAGNAAVKDRHGNKPNVVLDQSGNVLNVNGNEVVVLGAYYQSLGQVGTAELDNILNVQSQTFAAQSDPPAGYVLPTYQQAQYAVNLWKVTYNSVIPELGNEPVTATGLVAIPVADSAETAAGGPISRPLLSYQHGTVYGLHDVPSYSFSPNPDSQADPNSYETRLSVAQFAGQGYVVIAADYFGMGDSTVPDAYVVKASEQQACLDMLGQSSGLIKSQNVNVTNLLISGWSQGGLVTMAFLQKLEQEGIKLTGTSTASAPSDPLAGTSAFLFNPRGPSEITPDGNWINTIFIIATFSFQEYYNKPGLALNFFNPQYYEACREVYTREYDHISFDPTNGNLLVYSTPDDPSPLVIPANLTELIRPQYFNPNDVSPSDPSGPQYYPFSEFAGLLQQASAYQFAINSPVQLNYGTNDEAFSPAVAVIANNWQSAINMNNPIEPVPVTLGNHRGTYLTAVANQLNWFNALLGRDPGPTPP